jgi:hypothetical protein
VRPDLDALFRKHNDAPLFATADQVSTDQALQLAVISLSHVPLHEHAFEIVPVRAVRGAQIVFDRD